MARQITPLSMTLDKTGITAPYRGAFSNNGGYYAIGLNTQSPYIVVYDTSTTPWTRLTQPVDLPGNVVYCIAFNPTDTLCAVAHSVSPYITIYDTTTTPWSKINTGMTFTTGTRFCEFSPNGLQLVTYGTSSPYIRVFNTTPWSALSNPATLPAFGGYSGAFIEDGGVFVFVDGSYYLKAYNTTTTPWTYLSDYYMSFTGIQQYIAVSPSKDFLVYRHNVSPFIGIYDITKRPWVKLPDPDQSLPNGANGLIKFSPDGAICAFAQAASPWVLFYDTTVTPWQRIDNPSTLPTTTVQHIAFSGMVGGTVITGRSSDSPVSSVATISYDDFIIAVGTNASAPQLYLYEPKTLESIATGLTFDGSDVIFNIAFSPDGKQAILAYGRSNNYKAVVYTIDNNTWTVLTTLYSGATKIVGAVWSPDGKYAALNADIASGYPKVFNTVDWSSVTLGSTSTGYNKVTFSPDSKYLFCCQVQAPGLVVYDTATWTVKQDYEVDLFTFGPNFSPAYPEDVDLSPIGTEGTAVGSSPYVRRFSLLDFSLLPSPATLPTNTAICVRYSPDGSKLAVGSTASPYLFVYNLSDLSTVSISNPPNSGVRSLAWSKDGSTLYVGTTSTPFLHIYETTTWTKLSNPTVLPSIQVNTITIPPVKNYLKDKLLPAYIPVKTPPVVPVYQCLHSGTQNVNLLSNLPTDQTWNGVVCSNDGTYVYVGASYTAGYYHKRSSDGGSSFSDMANMTRNYTAFLLTCSNDGKYVIGQGYTGSSWALYLSEDYGETSAQWSPNLGTLVSAAAISNNKDVAILDVHSTSSPYWTIYSNGLFFDQATYGSLTRVHLDSSGTIALMFYNNGKILSLTRGRTWATVSTTTNGGLNLSRNGKYLLIWGSDNTYVRKSLTSTISLSATTLPQSGAIDAAISDDGTVIMALYATGLLVSRDGGATYTNVTSAISASGWGGRVAMSGCGKVAYVLNTTAKTLYKYTET